jgi:transcriptional regulator with XRE-family HTH domain
MAAALDKVTELGDYLREQRQHAKLSLRQLADVAGVSNPYLSQVERGLRKPSAEVLQQIAKGLRISAEVLYVRAGLLEERGDRIGVETAILGDPLLTERQRRVLLDIYETFRTENSREPAGPEVAVSAPRPKPRKATTKKTTAKKATRKQPAATERPAPEGGK